MVVYGIFTAILTAAAADAAAAHNVAAMLSCLVNAMGLVFVFEEKKKKILHTWPFYFHYDFQSGKTYKIS